MSLINNVVVVVITDGEGPIETAARQAVKQLVHRSKGEDGNFRLIFRLCTNNINTLSRWQKMLREEMHVPRKSKQYFLFSNSYLLHANFAGMNAIMQSYLLMLLGAIVWKLVRCFVRIHGSCTANLCTECEKWACETSPGAPARAWIGGPNSRWI